MKFPLAPGYKYDPTSKTASRGNLSDRAYRVLGLWNSHYAHWEFTHEELRRKFHMSAKTIKITIDELMFFGYINCIGQLRSSSGLWGRNRYDVFPEPDQNPEFTGERRKMAEAINLELPQKKGLVHHTQRSNAWAILCAEKYPDKFTYNKRTNTLGVAEKSQISFYKRPGFKSFLADGITTSNGCLPSKGNHQEQEIIEVCGGGVLEGKEEKEENFSDEKSHPSLSLRDQGILSLAKSIDFDMVSLETTETPVGDKFSAESLSPEMPEVLSAKVDILTKEVKLLKEKGLPLMGATAPKSKRTPGKRGAGAKAPQQPREQRQNDSELAVLSPKEELAEMTQGIEVIERYEHSSAKQKALEIESVRAYYRQDPLVPRIKGVDINAILVISGLESVYRCLTTPEQQKIIHRRVRAGVLTIEMVRVLDEMKAMFTTEPERYARFAKTKYFPYDLELFLKNNFKNHNLLKDFSEAVIKDFKSVDHFAMPELKDDSDGSWDDEVKEAAEYVSAFKAGKLEITDCKYTKVKDGNTCLYVDADDGRHLKMLYHVCKEAPRIGELLTPEHRYLITEGMRIHYGYLFGHGIDAAEIGFWTEWEDCEEEFETIVEKNQKFHYCYSTVTVAQESLRQARTEHMCQLAEKRQAGSVEDFTRKAVNRLYTSTKLTDVWGSMCEADEIRPVWKTRLKRCVDAFWSAMEIIKDLDMKRYTTIIDVASKGDYDVALSIGGRPVTAAHWREIHAIPA